MFTLRFCLVFGAFVSTICVSTGMGNAQETEASGEEVAHVLLTTSKGEILLELDRSKGTRETTDNFVKYAKDGFYDGTIFHRVMDGFMIQGGGFTEEMKKKEPRRPIRNQAGNGKSNKKYTVAMARTDDPHSATAQFFINNVDNPGLDRANARDGYGYTVFGKVIKGTETVDKISKVPTRTVPPPAAGMPPMSDVPVEPVRIKSAKVVDEDGKELKSAKASEPTASGSGS